MVFGGVLRERLQLNEDTLWGGGPYDPSSEEAFEALPEVRRLIFAGKYEEAHELADRSMMGKPRFGMPYQTVGDLVLESVGLGPTTDYRRSLTLDDALVRVRFVFEGVQYTREAFASAVEQVILLRLTASEPGKIGFDVSLSTPHEATVAIESEHALVMRGRNESLHGVQAALSFCAGVSALSSGGRVTGGADALSIRGADEVLLLVTAATSYRRYDDVSGDPIAVVRGRLQKAEGKGYDALLREHLEDYRELFGRVSIDLGGEELDDTSTSERVRQSPSREDPRLAALYLQYARYLMIACSRPGSQPANLQGLWNDSLDPPWGSKYTININTEMNYWPVQPLNLSECVEPLVRMLKDMAQTGARTARVNYGARRGWVAHHNTDLWRCTAPVDGAKWGLWPTGGAWLCMHLWEHYLYNRDENYLGEVYPVLKGACEFFLETLVEDEKTGFLVTCPSLSPENVHPEGVSLCAGPAMDQQILRDLFDHTREAASVLGLDPDFREKLLAARGRLAPDRIGAEGQLQEWLEDWDARAPEPHHRHVSHLYALFPSDQIHPARTPELAAAAKKSLEARGDFTTGWGIGWRINLWARLGDGERAHRALKLLLGPERSYPNLFDAHPPFQIDGNFGGASGICQMLLQCYGDTIHLLPALPAAWRRGSIRGLRARGGFDVEISWLDGVLRHARLVARPGVPVTVRYGSDSIGFDPERHQELDLGLSAGKLVVAPHPTG